MTVHEWNELIRYGNTVCERLEKLGYNVRLHPYTVYDGRKGLCIQVMDNTGDVFRTYHTGIDDARAMKNRLDSMAQRIVAEC